MTFAYDGGEPVLRDVDLDVEAGRTVALVGATGSGKTTLVMLIPRLYDVTAEGAVLVDGADVRDVDLGSLRREIALVSDDAFLFSATPAREHRLRAPGGDATRRCARPPAAPGSPSSSRTCRTATRRSSASAG